MKDVQCYELFGGIALKNHEFFIFIFFAMYMKIIRLKPLTWTIDFPLFHCITVNLLFYFKFASSLFFANC